MHPNVRPDLRYHHIFQCTTTSRLWVKVHPWCHRQKGAREWHDYCRRRVEYGFPECVFWHGWMVERMRSEVELVVVGVVEVDDEWQALLWGLHSSLITVTCPPYFFASRPPNQPKFFFFFLHSGSICSPNSYIVDVFALVKRTNELGSPLLVATILWSREKKFIGPTMDTKCFGWVLGKFQASCLVLFPHPLSQWNLQSPVLVCGEIHVKRTPTIKLVEPKIF